MFQNLKDTEGSSVETWWLSIKNLFDPSPWAFLSLPRDCGHVTGLEPIECKQRSVLPPSP